MVVLSLIEKDEEFYLRFTGDGQLAKKSNTKSELGATASRTT